MYFKSYCLLFIVASIFPQGLCSLFVRYHVNLFSNGPIVVGGTITFKAVVTSEDNPQPVDQFKYIWLDNAVPAHSGEIKSTHNVFEWNVTYTSDHYPGSYEMQLNLEKCVAFFCYPEDSARITFNITNFLNGDLKLIQNNKEIAHDKYVAVNEELVHLVHLNEADERLVQTNATSLDTYIFVDCQYRNVTKDLSFTHTYTDLNAEHLIEVLVVVSFDPAVIVPSTSGPPTSGNGTGSNSTSGAAQNKLSTEILKNLTEASNSSNSANSTLKLEEINVQEIRPNQLSTTTTRPTPTTLATSVDNKSVVSSSTTSFLPSQPSQSVSSLTSLPQAAAPTVRSTISTTTSALPPPIITNFPYVCNNSSTVPPDLHKTYGYFSKKVKVEAAIKNVDSVGKTWLPHGDMLSLEIKCNGSGPFTFCVQYISGAYNVTGKERCVHTIVNRDQCSFHIEHYFSFPQQYTLVVVIENNVGKVVTPMGITVIKTVKHAQLSVIVVPVTASLLAVVLMVFGLAYYIQSRNRFIVETADFDFSHASTDMEYKTFRERLRDAVSAAMNKTQDYEEENVWTPPDQSSGRKYGSMQ